MSTTVIVNDRALRTPKTGVGHYVHELLRHVPRVCPELDYVPFYFTHVRKRRDLERARAPAAGRPIQGSRKPWSVRRALQAAYEVYFRGVGKLRGYRLYHEPNHVPMRFGGTTITTVHDLSVLRFPEWHPADRVKWYEAGFRRGLKQTDHFIAVSQFTKREMIELLGIAPERITTIHQGPREVFTPAAGEEYQPRLRQLDVTPPFFLFVGTLEPRKNLSSVLRAYRALPGALRQRHQLVIAGGIGWGELGDVAGGENIRLVGYVSDETLRLLYSACHAFLWPSLYEGFGLPPLECMACGRPVITSNVASLPEVVGDAAVTVDPADIAALTIAMQRLAEDDDHAGQLARAGLRRAAEFSWTRCAQQHAEVFLKFV